MNKLEQLIKARKLVLTPEEQAGVKSRLVFAGLTEDLASQEDTALAGDLLDKLVVKMKNSNKNIREYAEETSTMPKVDAFSAGSADEKSIMVSLVNGRLAHFNAQSNVVMPQKKTTV